MLDAFAHLSKKHPNLHLVLSGGGKLVGADVEIINRLKLNQKVHHHQVNDAQLNYLYKNALLFIYPSLYEGFGLPILEAFRANCPILLSNTDCFLEIAQDAAGFFNRYSLEDLMLQIDQLISQESLRKNLVEKGNRRLRDFPIEKSMKQTLELYKSLK